MIDGAHVVVFSRNPEADRQFFKQVVALRFVDAGGGWPVFELPPSELAVHPDDAGGRQELYLMCGDLEATISRLNAAGIEVDGQPRDASWGRLVSLRLPGGGSLGLYQPKHPRAAGHDR
jgi:predicted enzyme related to lactoylglutathione lyase